MFEEVKIINKPEAEYEYQAQLGNATVFFNDASQTYNHLVAIRNNEKLLRFQLENAAPTSTVITDNTVIYPEAYPDVDLRYTVSQDKLKEDLVIKNQTAQHKFRFTMLEENVQASFLEDGSIQYKDENGEVIWTIETPYAYDANGSELMVNLEYMDCCYSIEVLVDENTVYPIVLDPTITASSTTYLGYLSGYGSLASANESTTLRFSDLAIRPSSISLQAAYWSAGAAKTAYSIAGSYHYYIQYVFRDASNTNIGAVTYLTNTNVTALTVPVNAESLFVYAYRRNTTTNTSSSVRIDAICKLVSMQTDDTKFKESFALGISNAATILDITLNPTSSYTVNNVSVFANHYTQYAIFAPVTINTVKVNGVLVDKTNFNVNAGDTVLVNISKPAATNYTSFAVLSNNGLIPVEVLIDTERLKTNPGWQTSVEIFCDTSRITKDIVTDTPATVYAAAQVASLNTGKRTIAQDSNGNTYVAYLRGSRVYVAKSLDLNTWTDLAMPNSYTQMSPAIEIDALDNLHVIWYGTSASSPSYYQVGYCKYNGSVWSAAVNPSIVSSYSQGEPSIVIDSNNNPHIVWAGRDASNASYDQIKYTFFNGSVWSTWVNIQTITSYTQQYPYITIDSQDKLHVLWHGTDSFNPSYYQVKYSSKEVGGAWTAWVDVQKTSGYYQLHPSAIVDSQDNLHVFCHGTDALNTSYQIKYSKLTASIWSDWNNIQTITGYYQQYPIPHIDPHDNIRVFWQGTDASNPTKYQIKYSKLQNGWNPWENVITNTESAQPFPCIPERTASESLPVVYMDGSSPYSVKVVSVTTPKNGTITYPVEIFFDTFRPLNSIGSSIVDTIRHTTVVSETFIDSTRKALKESGILIDTQRDISQGIVANVGIDTVRTIKSTVEIFSDTSRGIMAPEVMTMDTKRRTAITNSIYTDTVRQTAFEKLLRSETFIPWSAASTTIVNNGYITLGDVTVTTTQAIPHKAWPTGFGYTIYTNIQTITAIGNLADLVLNWSVPNLYTYQGDYFQVYVDNILIKEWEAYDVTGSLRYDLSAGDHELKLVFTRDTQYHTEDYVPLNFTKKEIQGQGGTTQKATSGTVISNEFNVSEIDVTSLVKFMVNQTLPAGTSVKYSYAVDLGSTYTEITAFDSYSLINAINSATYVKFKAELTGTTTVSPVVNNLQLYYKKIVANIVTTIIDTFRSTKKADTSIIDTKRARIKNVDIVLDTKRKPAVFAAIINDTKRKIKVNNNIILDTLRRYRKAVVVGSDTKRIVGSDITTLALNASQWLYDVDPGTGVTFREKYFMIYNYMNTADVPLSINYTCYSSIWAGNYMLLEFQREDGSVISTNQYTNPNHRGTRTDMIPAGTFRIRFYAYSYSDFNPTVWIDLNNLRYTKPVTFPVLALVDSFRITRKSLNLLADTKRITRVDSLIISDTLRTVVRRTSVILPADTHRIVNKSVQPALNSKRRIVKNNLLLVDTKIVSVELVDLTADTSRIKIANGLVKADTIRSLRKDIEVILDTERLKGIMDTALFDTVREYFSLEGTATVYVTAVFEADDFAVLRLIKK
jgi:hypothetical protein